MLELEFRNLAVSPRDPVEQWGVEGIDTALERGTIVNWIPLADAIKADPNGPVALDCAQAISLHQPVTGAFALMEVVLERARQGQAGQVARRIGRALRRSGLTQREFASRLGTSASRLSTYATGQVIPSATLLIRIEDLAGACVWGNQPS